MRQLFVVVALLINGLPAVDAGTDLGVAGQTYAIAEPSLLETIDAKLKTAQENGELAKIERDMKARFIAHANRPHGVSLPRAKRHQVRFIDPTMRLSQDIKDHKGRVLWPAGTAVNPLEYTSLSQHWVFFNGDDPEQAAWARAYAKRYPEQVRLILTQGAVVERMTTWQLRLYFDQGRKLVERFGIEALPSVVSQDGKRLRVDEMVPEGHHG